MKESNLIQQIKIYCGEINWICFHTNVGKIPLPDGSYFTTGLPKGWPDLMVITDTGTVFYCEAKTGNNKPSAEQIKIIKLLNQRNVHAFVAYTLDEFKNHLKNRGIK